jgi:hypothetical protein
VGKEHDNRKNEKVVVRAIFIARCRNFGAAAGNVPDKGFSEVTGRSVEAQAFQRL